MIYNIYFVNTVLRGPDVSTEYCTTEVLAVAGKVSILKGKASNNAEDNKWS